MARGFNTTSGSATTDRVTTTLTAHAAASVRSYAVWFWANTGISTAAQMWSKTAGSAVVDYAEYISSGSVLRYNRGWTGNGTWSVPFPSLDAWHHLVVTYDESSSANAPKIYLDGVSQTVTTAAGPTGTVTTNADAYVIGNRGSASRGWNGLLAEWAVWDRILTADEAAALAKGYSPGFLRQSLVEHVPMLRDNISRVLAAPTLTGTAVQPHPKVIYPASSSWRAIVGSGSSAQALAGASAGAATVTGAAMMTIPLAGTLAGVATVLGGLGGLGELSGATGGAATVTGAVNVALAVAGSSDGAAGAVGSLTDTKLKKIAFEGDSLTYGLRATSGGGTVTGTVYPARVMAALGASYVGRNSGISGALIAAMGGEDGFYDAAAPSNLYVLMGGTNDLDGSASGATVEGRIITHLASHGHPIGYRVLVCVPPACGTFTAPKNAALAAYAALLRANWHSYADGLVDFLADPRLADPLDTTYFNGDTIHCNDTGYQVMADLVVAAIAALPSAATSRRNHGRFAVVSRVAVLAR